MFVLKFGGSSVADASRLRRVADIIVDKIELDKLVVVVSAFGGVTDLLIKITDLASEGDKSYVDLLKELLDRINSVCTDLLPSQAYHDIEVNIKENHFALERILEGVFLTQEASNKTRDYILSFGERNSAFILTNYLLSRGVKAEYIDAREFIFTDDNYGAAVVDFELSYDTISQIEKKDQDVFIATGFIGSDRTSGRTTTLGRGGSDYSAAIFAAGLDAEQLEIWTDVNGVLTSDPRVVKRAYSIPQMTYSEALEMSHFGAKVLYAPTIRPVRSKGIPTIIKNTFEPEHPGTKIYDNKTIENGFATGLSAIKDCAMITIEGPGLQGVKGFASRFFGCLARADINIIMITQASSEHSISIAVLQENSVLAVQCIEEEFEFEMRRDLVDPITTINDLSLLAVIGEKMRNRPGVSGLLFNTLGKNGVNVEAISQGSSELNITIAIKSEDRERALNCIHDAFFLSGVRTTHLFIVGVGLIGSKLIEQLNENHDDILKGTGQDLVINGLSNSKKMVLSAEGISLDDYQTLLVESDMEADVETMIDQMIALNLPHSIFVDNTASADIPKHYARILKNNIAISTPNKIAMSEDMENYVLLKDLSLRHHIPFKYETNVAAGLPVISTLENLKQSGDSVQKIEAVLSGSVSYIFNNYDGSKPFATIVKEAQDKGLTEPDPREDLSGADVRRKILILARESGVRIEESDVEIDPILNEETMNAVSVESFYENLSKDENRLKGIVEHAFANESRVRFIASYEEGKASIGMKVVDNKSPFYGLNGSDNMIVFHTKRYNHTPLVVRGPGAGADVTAAGVLAEIINIGNLI